MVKPVAGHPQYIPRENPFRLPDDKNKGIVRDGGNPRDGSLINPEPASANSAAGGKAGTNAFNSSQKKYKLSPKSSLDEDESDEESQYSMGTESLQAGDGITSASDSTSLKLETKKGKVSARHKSKSKKKSINGSPRKPGDSDESDSERRDVPRKEPLEAGGGIKNASVFRSSYSTNQGPVLGQEKTSTLHASKLAKKYQNNPFHGFGKNKAIVSDGDDPQDGSVINPEPGSAKFKQIPKRPQGEDESGKENQNVFVKECESVTENIVDPKKPDAKKKEFVGRNAGESGREGQNMLSKLLLEEDGGKSSASTSISSRTVEEWHVFSLKKTKIKTKRNRSEFIPSAASTLDLHNKNKEEAERDTKAFLQSFSSPKIDVIVTVIPGRGKHSKDSKPILLPMVLELLKDLKLNNYKLYNLDGAVDITIEKGWLYSPTGYKNCIQISNFFDSSNNSKGASSSNAQVSPSQEEYKIEANDNDGYVGIIKDFASKITRMEKDEISLRMDSSIFQQENTEFFYVFRNDLAAFCNMETVDVTLISAYMRFLFAKYEKSCEIITFLYPASTREELREIICGGSKEMKKKKQKKQKKLLFIPFYIQSMFHWVLMVIDCSSMTVFWVDSSHTKPDILTVFTVKTGLNPLASPDTERPSWKIIKGPMHTNSVRSGYFVMKFMRDLIFTNEQSQSIVVKMEKLAEKETYTEEEINLVRAEFINCILVLGGI